MGLGYYQQYQQLIGFQKMINNTADKFFHQIYYTYLLYMQMQ